MPTLEETRATIKAAIDSYWDAIAAAQQSRLANKGTYLQRIRTHSTVPQDGIQSAPDQLENTPSDESETGQEYFTFPAQTYTAITINVSDGPTGKTFTCIFEFDWSETGMRQRKVIHGPVKVEDDWGEYDPTATPIL
jgi:hypothetical protein